MQLTKNGKWNPSEKFICNTSEEESPESRHIREREKDTELGMPAVGSKETRGRER